MAYVRVIVEISEGAWPGTQTHLASSRTFTSPAVEELKDCVTDVYVKASRIRDAFNGVSTPGYPTLKNIS